MPTIEWYAIPSPSLSFFLQHSDAKTDSLKYYSDPAFKQDVRHTRPGICDSTVVARNESILLGQSAHLTCSQPHSALSSEGDIVWLHNGRRIRFGERALRTHADAGLVVLDSRRQDGGLYECLVGGVLACRVRLRVDAEACGQVPRAKDDYRRVYREWCEEFHRYRKQISHWDGGRSKVSRCWTEESTKEMVVCYEYTIQGRHQLFFDGGGQFQTFLNCPPRGWSGGYLRKCRQERRFSDFSLLKLRKRSRKPSTGNVLCPHSSATPLIQFLWYTVYCKLGIPLLPCSRLGKVL